MWPPYWMSQKVLLDSIGLCLIFPQSYRFVSVSISWWKQSLGTVTALRIKDCIMVPHFQSWQAPWWVSLTSVCHWTLRARKLLSRNCATPAHFAFYLLSSPFLKVNPYICPINSFSRNFTFLFYFAEIFMKIMILFFRIWLYRLTGI